MKRGKFCKLTKSQNPKQEGLRKSQWKLQNENSTPNEEGRKDGENFADHYTKYQERLTKKVTEKNT